MKIETLAQIDYNDRWLIYTRSGELKTTLKDPLWLRWIKTVFQILTFYFYDVYSHMKINRVAQGLFEKFQFDIKENPNCTKYYVTTINKLLSLDHLIRTHREELLRTKIKILNFEKNHQF